MREMLDPARVDLDRQCNEMEDAVNQTMPQKIPHVTARPCVVDMVGGRPDLVLDMHLVITDLPVSAGNAPRQIADTLQKFVDELRKNLGD